jgi:catechol 2,3-dioxygenase-like lactoylglutathione lyase family enzyme
MQINESNITINVKDLNKSVLFYESLGLQIKHRWNNKYAQLAGPGVNIGLHPADDENLKRSSGNTSLGFTIDNIHEAKDLLQKLAVSFSERQEEGGQYLRFEDPDGISLYFIKPRWL